MVRLWIGTMLLAAQPGGQMPGTEPLTWTGDLSVRMMDGAHRFVERKIRDSVAARQRHWQRNFSSRAAYEASVAPNRRRLMERIGVVDPRVRPGMERLAGDDSPELVAETGHYRILQVRWPVLEGVHGEGLLLEPKGQARDCAVVLPDAGESPEQMAGLSPGISMQRQFARRLAELGWAVVVPVLVDRTARWSGRPGIRATSQPHREWIYRQAFHMGRHIIGYEVQKVLAAVDWFRRKNTVGRMAVAGHGEGGLIAFYSAAVDTRIDAAVVSGYFQPREALWKEPIDRNVWGLLEEFGDAEIATLIAPRMLVIASLESVEAEFARIGGLLRPAFQRRFLVSSGAEAMRVLAGAPAGKQEAPRERRAQFDPAARQKRQVQELEVHVQNLVEESEETRSRFFLHKVAPEFADESWSTRREHASREPGGFIEGARWYRDYFWREAMGRFDDPLLPPRPRTRKIYDAPKWTGYEVVLDIWEDVFAWGILLVPNDIRTGERRPVVVCQHGRNGVPADTIEQEDSPYGRFAARLADRGFITFSPHNLYRGEDRDRYLSRKANGVKGSLFSFIIGQHDGMLRWLETLPFVDGRRIAFYGLSYGGETAMRVPAVLEKYCLSICSGDFNNWTRKVASTRERFSFMYTIEWEMPYFNLGNTFDYAEMAYLIFPRPFMVERGHHDRVGRDRWVAYEYAKVRWLYTQFDLPHYTRIEYFNGGHAIHGQGTFEFLARHLNWPKR